MAKSDELITLLQDKGIEDTRVLQAIAQVPRDLFVPLAVRNSAYQDIALPIEHGQTISQPYILALMLQEANLTPTSTVLEIGAGSGYGAAVLSYLVKEVYSLDIIDNLINQSQIRLNELGCTNIKLKTADGHAGWEEMSPFDAIVMTAATFRIPDNLLKQLKIGGTLIAPISKSSNYQELTKIIRKGADYYKYNTLLPVRFVPFV